MNILSTRKCPGKFSNRGHSLIEVLIGMVIFALGIMALASLQGNLARNSGDSNARTVANNLAEEVIEAARNFGQVPPSDPPGSTDAFADIVSSEVAEVIERGGVNYEVTSVVTDYFYDTDTGTFLTENTGSALFADMKLLELTVTWNTEQEFQIDASTHTEGQLGSGSIKLTDVISSITSPSGGKVSLVNLGSNGYAPPVDYHPGENPEIVSIQIGNEKFKESTTPLPDVIRTDELVETRFDVVTYSQLTGDTLGTFLRREEFRAISCECTLRIPSTEGEGGLRPTIWGGSEYSEAEYIAKTFGESGNGLQSEFCSLCCRDHHDSPAVEGEDPDDPGRLRFDPFSSSANFYDSGPLAGDHKHYNRDNRGELVLANTDGAAYLEACRLVRKNGFFRVAQDLRQEGLNTFPANYLDEEGEVGQYSGYVTGAVSQFESDMGATNGYELSPPSLIGTDGVDPPFTFPASTFASATSMPTNEGSTEQQLRARGIYIDYMSDELRVKINCLDIGGTSETCETPNISSALEIIPFYDVQLTWLARWNESPNNNPVDVSNNTIQSNNSHSRGKASLQSGFGYSTVSSKVHKGNLGLTGTDPIDLQYTDNEKDYFLYALAYDSSSPPPLSTNAITGTITSAVPGIRAADVEIKGLEAQCDRTNTGFECFPEVGANKPMIEVFGYAKGQKLLKACSEVLDIFASDNANNDWTKFKLPLEATPFANIVIMENSCL